MNYTFRVAAILTLLSTIYSFAKCGPCVEKQREELPIQTYNPCDRTTSFRLSFGCYRVSLYRAELDCPIDVSNLLGGYTNHDLEMPTGLTFNDQDGTIAFSSYDGLLRGSGPLPCNTGFLLYGPATERSGDCSWTTTRISSVQLSRDDLFTIYVRDIRENPSAGCGQLPPRCTATYRLWARKQ